MTEFEALWQHCAERGKGRCPESFFSELTTLFKTVKSAEQKRALNSNITEVLQKTSQDVVLINALHSVYALRSGIPGVNVGVSIFIQGVRQYALITRGQLTKAKQDVITASISEILQSEAICMRSKDEQSAQQSDSDSTTNSECSRLVSQLLGLVCDPPLRLLPVPSEVLENYLLALIERQDWAPAVNFYGLFGHRVGPDILSTMVIGLVNARRWQQVGHLLQRVASSFTEIPQKFPSSPKSASSTASNSPSKGDDAVSSDLLEEPATSTHIYVDEARVRSLARMVVESCLETLNKAQKNILQQLRLSAKSSDITEAKAIAEVEDKDTQVEVDAPIESATMAGETMCDVVRLFQIEDLNGKAFRARKNLKFLLLVKKGKWQIASQMVRYPKEAVFLFELLKEAGQYREADTVYQDHRLSSVMVDSHSASDVDEIIPNRDLQAVTPEQLAIQEAASDALYLRLPAHLYNIADVSVGSGGIVMVDSLDSLHLASVVLGLPLEWPAGSPWPHNHHTANNHTSATTTTAGGGGGDGDGGDGRGATTTGKEYRWVGVDVEWKADIQNNLSAAAGRKAADALPESTNNASADESVNSDGEVLVGGDTGDDGETANGSDSGAASGAHILQVASANHVFIFDFVGLFQPTPTTTATATSAAVGSRDPRRQNQVLLQRLMGSLLQQLFSSEEIVKVGWSFGVADIRMLRKSGQGSFGKDVFSKINSLLELTYLLQNMSNYSLAPSPAAVPENSSEKVPGNVAGGVDSTNISEEEQNKFLEKLSAFAKSKKGMALSTACSHLLGRPLNKTDRLSDWTLRPLTPSQLRYAALDAHCLLALTDALLFAARAPSSLRRQLGVEGMYHFSFVQQLPPSATSATGAIATADGNGNSTDNNNNSDQDISDVVSSSGDGNSTAGIPGSSGSGSKIGVDSKRKKKTTGAAAAGGGRGKPTFPIGSFPSPFLRKLEVVR